MHLKGMTLTDVIAVQRRMKAGDPGPRPEACDRCGLYHHTLTDKVECKLTDTTSEQRDEP